MGVSPAPFTVVSGPPAASTTSSAFSSSRCLASADDRRYGAFWISRRAKKCSAVSPEWDCRLGSAPARRSSRSTSGAYRGTPWTARWSGVQPSRSRARSSAVLPPSSAIQPVNVSRKPSASCRRIIGPTRCISRVRDICRCRAREFRWSLSLAVLAPAVLAEATLPSTSISISSIVAARTPRRAFPVVRRVCACRPGCGPGGPPPGDGDRPRRGTGRGPGGAPGRPLFAPPLPPSP